MPRPAGAGTGAGGTKRKARGGLRVAGDAHGPLEQFRIKELVDIPVAGVDLDITNSTVWMAVAAAGVIAVMVGGTCRAGCNRLPSSPTSS